MKFLKIILPVLLMLPLMSQAQCRSFTKKKCLPELEGYVQNDNFNSAVLIPGDEAELLLTFYAGKEYRLLVCGHPVLGDLEFEVLDTDDEVIYTNIDEEIKADSKFDFKVATTQQLIVRIRVPEAESSSTLIHEGCVSVLIGSKEN
ncbi:MAG: hypothetical protein ACJAU0_001125 [Flavobacteriales bacterium]|jgi:hypothetical protein